ncbi:hypothetical protein BYT27DRAFT_7226663 [Phlegmacium glaucopus]|nr:hypothetical protein BYT27DRAFT_7226663 [Phlegmacium glaucopus]
MEANWSGWASFFSSRTLVIKTLGYGVSDVKRDENGMEVMDIDDDDDEHRGKDLLRDSGHGETRPVELKTSDSRDSDPSLRPSDSTGGGSLSPTKLNVSSTPKKGNSGSNTPLPFSSLPPSPSPEKNQNHSTPNTPTTSTSTKKVNNQRTASPAPSKKSISSPPPPPNLVLPTWKHTFHTAPRNVVPPAFKHQSDDGVGGMLLGKTMRFVSGMFARDANDGSAESGRKMKGKEREISNSGEVREVRRREELAERFKEFGKDLPKPWQIFKEAASDTDTTPTMSIPSFGFCSPNKGSQVGVGVSGVDKDVLRGCKKAVIIGIHGWFPGPMLRTVVGEPTGTSTKFANMTEQALQQFEDEHGVKLEKITKIPLEGDGTIETRVERLYNNLKANDDWMTDLHEADAIIVSTHSQGSIVSTHLLNRLIQDNHIITARNQQHQQLAMSLGTGAETFLSAIGLPEEISRRSVQRVCCVALCGTHLGPLRYLSSSTLVGPYIQYFESTAARELFEFQNTESAVSKAYVQALQNVLDHGIKMLYIASLNDQVVPLYSGLFTAASHPLILRALYIDGDAYHSSDFLSNLLVLLLRILNSGISDSGLIAHLSEATAGSLIGVGHSTAYEELTTFSLAVKYLFLANEGLSESTELRIEPFNASQEQNDYEIPWSLRDIIADERVSHFFSRDIAELRDAFREWHPKTSILRDLKRKLQPITRLPSSSTPATLNSLGSGMSKL